MRSQWEQLSAIQRARWEILRGHCAVCWQLYNAITVRDSLKIIVFRLGILTFVRGDGKITTTLGYQSLHRNDNNGFIIESKLPCRASVARVLPLGPYCQLLNLDIWRKNELWSFCISKLILVSSPNDRKMMLVFHLTEALRLEATMLNIWHRFKLIFYSRTLWLKSISSILAI